LNGRGSDPANPGNKIRGLRVTSRRPVFATARQKVDVLLSVRKSYLQAPSPGRLMERQTRALEAIAARLTDIDTKLERVLQVIEHDNPAATPF
jgi:hypothetical protein